MATKYLIPHCEVHAHYSCPDCNWKAHVGKDARVDGAYRCPTHKYAPAPNCQIMHGIEAAEGNQRLQREVRTLQIALDDRTGQLRRMDDALTEMTRDHRGNKAGMQQVLADLDRAQRKRDKTIDLLNVALAERDTARTELHNATEAVAEEAKPDDAMRELMAHLRTETDRARDERRESMLEAEALRRELNTQTVNAAGRDPWVGLGQWMTVMSIRAGFLALLAVALMGLVLVGRMIVG